MKHAYTEILVQNCEWITSDEKEIILFGFKQGKSMMQSILMTVLIGAVMHMPWESFLFTIFFFPLRKYAGGFHAKTQLRCTMISVITIIVVLRFLKVICWTKILNLSWGMLCFILIWFMAPVENEKRMLGVGERKSFKRKARIIAVVEFLCMLLFLYFQQYHMGSIIIASYMVTSLCLISGQIKQSNIGMA